MKQIGNHSRQFLKTTSDGKAFSILSYFVQKPRDLPRFLRP